MIQRIFTNWTFTRALYLIIGTIIVTQSVVSHQWFGVAFGTYFAAMGLFSFGCAAGNCAVAPKQKSSAAVQDVEFKEIKVK